MFLQRRMLLPPNASPGSKNQSPALSTAGKALQDVILIHLPKLFSLSHAPSLPLQLSGFRAFAGMFPFPEVPFPQFSQWQKLHLSGYLGLTLHLLAGFFPQPTPKVPPSDRYPHSHYPEFLILLPLPQSKIIYFCLTRYFHERHMYTYFNESNGLL